MAGTVAERRVRSALGARSKKVMEEKSHPHITHRERTAAAGGGQRKRRLRGECLFHSLISRLAKRQKRTGPDKGGRPISDERPMAHTRKSRWCVERKKKKLNREDEASEREITK